MSDRDTANLNPSEAVESQPHGSGLPDRIARLINPEVLAQRLEKINMAEKDAEVRTARRRRYVSTLGEHLWKELKNA